MSKIIEALFTVLEPTAQSEAEARAMAKVEAIVQDRLDGDDLDRLWAAALELQWTNQLDSFTQGLRLGMQLTLEGLGPVRHED